MYLRGIEKQHVDNNTILYKSFGVMYVFFFSTVNKCIIVITMQLWIKLAQTEKNPLGIEQNP